MEPDNVSKALTATAATSSLRYRDIAIAGGVLLGAALIAAVIAIVVVRTRIADNVQNVCNVVPALDLHSHRHRAIRAPADRPATAQLPRGVKRIALANYPTIDRFEGVWRPADAAALLGLPGAHADPPVPLTPTSGSAQVAYLHQDKRTTQQRLGTVVGFEGAGGGVAFPYFSYTVKGAPGRAVAWLNVTPSGHGDPRTAHHILPGTKGWVVHIWDLPRHNSFHNGGAQAVHSSNAGRRPQGDGVSDAAQGAQKG